MPEVTKEQVAAVLGVIVELGRVIKELGSVPSGELYAQLMGKVSLREYQLMLEQLKKAGLITVTNHLIEWKGGN